ncbi:MAG: PIN domain-containing protein [Chitinophagaceae bacterium]|nr:PIN domain-containing protein [Chitinophagaceae bacterium]
MTLFLDANILVSVLNKEYPLFTYTSRILSLAGKKPYVLKTSAVCLAIAYYFAEKKHGAASARNKISLLLDYLQITDCGEKEAMQAITNQKANDFEDALQYYSAFNAKCTCLLTDNVADFYFSGIRVLHPEAFFNEYILGKK